MQFTPTAIRFQFAPYQNATHSTQPVPFELMLIIAPSTWLALSQGLRERCHNRELSRPQVQSVTIADMSNLR